MPKLLTRPPQYKKCGKYAVVYVDGKRKFLGLFGSQESKVAYARVLAERESPTLSPPKGARNVTVKELAAAFLDHAKVTLRKPNYVHHRIVVLDFLKKLYGDGTLVDDFKPSCLKLLREAMIKAVNKRGEPRFCRGMINDYVRRIVRIFSWGVEEGIVHSDTTAVLKAVKPLPEGYAGTFDREERKDVPDAIIKATLPFMPPVLRAMIKLQRLTGCRPSEIFNMRVGQIDKDSDPEFWLYRLSQHKTKAKTKRKKVIPLSKIEQELIAPYLVGKKSTEAVFSPRTAQQEWHNGKRRVPKEYSEFYNKDSYRQAVEYAINKANKSRPDDDKIPRWTPYQIRHTAATAAELEVGFDGAQTLLDHERPDTTARYTHARLQKLKALARNRRDPFGEDATEQS
jgi:integrase